MKVYLVENVMWEPGKIYAIFTDPETAQAFIDQYHDIEASVVPRTLLHELPQIPKVNTSGYVE